MINLNSISIVLNRVELSAIYNTILCSKRYMLPSDRIIIEKWLSSLATIYGSRYPLIKIVFEKEDLPLVQTFVRNLLMNNRKHTEFSKRMANVVLDFFREILYNYDDKEW
jgi:hypothetical protein